MSGPRTLSEGEIIETLRTLNSVLTEPVWLFGGVAVDFLVGRWTRPHADIDLNAYAHSRDKLTRELGSLGFFSRDAGWLTHFGRGDGSEPLELVFLERSSDDSGILVIGPDDPVGAPGRYPMLPGTLDPNRFATLDGVSFRVTSPAAEWLARSIGSGVVPGRLPEPKLEHDRRLLEGLLSPAELDRLRAKAARGSGLRPRS